ncbi:MAG: ribose-5-phosphate isomerase RpiA [Theionarchaea archaeon]|nr:ribose-5-phosphate isomerase RpiA [Theionarchaea archaeon]
MSQAYEKRDLGVTASRMIKDGMVVGLGTGSTAAEFIKALGERIRTEGITVYGVPTSYQAHLLAEQHNIQIVTSQTIDIAVDGADQVDHHDFISKGGGGALLKEKLVDYRADRLMILADFHKFVEKITKVFVEVHPQAIHSVQEELSQYGTCVLRTVHGHPIEEGDQVFITESGNVIFDVKTTVEDPVRMERELNAIHGVMENGLFTRTCIVIQRPRGIPG